MDPALGPFHPAVREWFAASFPSVTAPQRLGWPPIAHGDSTLILSPTGSGKTLAAFLWCLNRLMFRTGAATGTEGRSVCRVLYVSPLKALAVDVERNLRAPLAGITAVAERRGDACTPPSVSIRTGDTPQAERARFRRDGADILITTPESLYLLLTASSREMLHTLETVIVDEIHALVPTKRGAHLALSLERLEVITGRPLQRIGLSATQRPLDEVARFLGGVVRAGPGHDPQIVVVDDGRPHGAAPTPGMDGDPRRSHQAVPTSPTYRPVTVVDTGERKRLDLTVEVPVEDLANLGRMTVQPGEIHAQPGLKPGPTFDGKRVPASIWPAMFPRLVELVRAHRTTLIFVNSRRHAERLAAALNELAGETMVRAHHGSLAREQRIDVEERLKAGLIRGIVATSSLELGIDMGAVDLVIQIEAPPSVASGMQRIGRGSHQVGAPSRGIVVPKFRGDLVACAAATEAMTEGAIETTRFPRNPLDVLAQQIVAMVSMDPWTVDALYDVVRRAAPYAGLGRAVFEDVLDLLSGRYPSSDFSELRPRITWNRVDNTLVARDGARRLAIVNGGTIPDRGRYGVFLAAEGSTRGRVGELDEEMVFESRAGDTFLLGASTWRIEEITHDRVLVSPAPGEPGRMPFWKGDVAGRPLEFGQRIGRLLRTLAEMPGPAARERLVRQHGLDERAAANLVQYLADQRASGVPVPDDRTLVIERYRDDLGDWRVSVLSALGGRVHAPWTLAVRANVRRTLGLDIETMWTDDGFVVRLPESEEPPNESLILIDPGEIDALVRAELGGSAVFAARFREAAGRALLLPRGRPGRRAPLWQQRKRAGDLLAAAARHPSFPIMLECYRECLSDVFDMPALRTMLGDVGTGRIRAVTMESRTPSPFAAALLFGYVANFMYDGDAPLAERRAQALAVDQGRLAELVGEIELRDLVDADTLAGIEARLQQQDERTRARSADSIHNLLLRLGDLSAAELRQRTEIADLERTLGALVRDCRIVPIAVAGESRFIPVEDGARYRDALGITLPAGLPDAHLVAARDPLGDLVARYARTHGPFTPADVAARYGLESAAAERAVRRLADAGRLVEGEFRPGGTHREWCDPDVLRSIRRRSLAHLRREAEPVEPPVLARFTLAWQGITRRRAGIEALLDAIEGLQGAPLAASIFETEILSRRVSGYDPADLDRLASDGELVWCGVERIGDRDGRIALYLSGALSRLWRPPAPPAADPVPRASAIAAELERRGASFFDALHQASGGGYPGETIDALWSLVWSGRVTNDSFHALRAFTRPPARERKTHSEGRVVATRRTVPPAGQGRWSLVASRGGPPPSITEWSAAMAEQLLARYGLVTREVAAAEGLAGGFSTVYAALRVMEERGRIRRGYFVSGVGAAQFGRPSAVELLRSLRETDAAPEAVQLAATDPANPYGHVLPWPSPAPGPSEPRLARLAGASVILVSGALAAYLGRGGRPFAAFLPAAEPERTVVARALAAHLAGLARAGEGREGGLLLSEINGAPAGDHPLAPYLVEAGFTASPMGYQVRRPRPESKRPLASA